MEDSWPYFHSHISHVENVGRTWEVKVLARSLCLAFRLCLYSLSLCLSLSLSLAQGGRYSMYLAVYFHVFDRVYRFVMICVCIWILYIVLNIPNCIAFATTAQGLLA